MGSLKPMVGPTRNVDCCCSHCSLALSLCSARYSDKISVNHAYSSGVITAFTVSFKLRRYWIYPIFLLIIRIICPMCTCTTLHLEYVHAPLFPHAG